MAAPDPRFAELNAPVPSPIVNLPAVADPARYGKLSVVRDAVQTAALGELAFPVVLRSTPLNLTYQQMVAYFSIVGSRFDTLDGLDESSQSDIVCFLEFAVPGNANIPILWPGRAVPANDGEKLAYVMARMDAYFFDAAGQVQARLANFAPARPADAAAADNRDATAVALDPFIRWPNAAARAARTIPEFLQACYDRSVDLRGKAGENRFLQALMMCAIAIAKRGACTPEKAGKIAEGVLQDVNIDLDVDPEDLIVRYRHLGPILRSANVSFADIFTSLAGVFDFQNYMRIHLTVIQSVGAGMSAVNLVLQAVKAYPGHEVWTYLRNECGAEMDAFLASARYAARNQFAGFGDRTMTEIVKGTRFPSVAYAAVELLKIRGRSKTVRKYRGKFDTHNASTITTLINKVEETAADDMKLDGFRGAGAYNWQASVADLTSLFSSLEV